MVAFPQRPPHHRAHQIPRPSCLLPLARQRRLAQDNPITKVTPPKSTNPCPKRSTKTISPKPSKPFPVSPTFGTPLCFASPLTAAPAFRDSSLCAFMTLAFVGRHKVAPFASLDELVWSEMPQLLDTIRKATAQARNEAELRFALHNHLLRPQGGQSPCHPPL